MTGRKGCTADVIELQHQKIRDMTRRGMSARLIAECIGLSERTVVRYRNGWVSGARNPGGSQPRDHKGRYIRG